MSDALPLPPRPSLAQYRKLAKDFQRACTSGDSNAVRAWARRLLETLARSWKTGSGAGGGDDPYRVRLAAHIDDEAARVERRWRTLRGTRAGERCRLTDAQFFVAREHGFESWPKFAAHVDTIVRGRSPVSTFERAADAIVAGDIAALRQLLRDHPDLVRARSTREHRSTLLHYVSANGVEDFRQKSPPNILEIATLLLEAGADVHAESEAYGGRSTTLGLTATSWHPEEAGAQLALMDLLMGHGARIDGPDTGSGVNACLHNGRGEAAAFLACRGARLDLEGAAGTGRLDAVRTYVTEDGSLKPPATTGQLKAGFTWACEFGHTPVVEFLLDHGVKVDASHGGTGLHWASYEGHADVVGLLLRRGAPVEVKDERWGGTPLGWALYGWGEAGEVRKRTRRYYETVALLVRAGALLDRDEERERALEKARADPRMAAALRGEPPADAPGTHDVPDPGFP